jgi:hypothetical protein
VSNAVQTLTSVHDDNSLFFLPRDVGMSIPVVMPIRHRKRSKPALPWLPCACRAVLKKLFVQLFWAFYS